MTSILIISHEEHDKLSLHLPSLLAQEGTEYEVVVVDMNSEDDTLELLSSLEEKYLHLRHLSLPTSARDISRERLALHLGMRTANYTHVLIMDASTEIATTDWLCEIEKRWRTDCSIMLIPTIRQRTKRIKDFLTTGHEAWRKSLYLKQVQRHDLYRADMAIVGLDKELFLKHNSSARDLALKTGTLDIFVAQAATKYNTICIAEAELFPKVDANADSHYWKQKRLYDVETRRHLPHRLKRRISYLQHCLCSIHRGSIPYSFIDQWDYLRWRFTSKKAFIKKHY